MNNGYNGTDPTRGAHYGIFANLLFTHAKEERKVKAHRTILYCAAAFAGIAAVVGIFLLIGKLMGP